MVRAQMCAMLVVLVVAVLPLAQSSSCELCGFDCPESCWNCMTQCPVEDTFLADFTGNDYLRDTSDANWDPSNQQGTGMHCWLTPPPDVRPEDCASKCNEHRKCIAYSTDKSKTHGAACYLYPSESCDVPAGWNAGCVDVYEGDGRPQHWKQMGLTCQSIKEGGHCDSNLANCARTCGGCPKEKACYLAYCNANDQLKNKFCDGNFCVSDSEYSSCKDHWNNRTGGGKSEGLTPNPESCHAGTLVAVVGSLRGGFVCHSHGCAPWLNPMPNNPQCSDAIYWLSRHPDTASVRCCNEAGTTCTQPESLACSGLKTREEAIAVCAAEGKRLCTLAEYESKTCCSTGCENDATPVWTNHSGGWHTSSADKGAWPTNNPSALTTAGGTVSSEVATYNIRRVPCATSTNLNDEDEDVCDKMMLQCDAKCRASADCPHSASNQEWNQKAQSRMLNVAVRYRRLGQCSGNSTLGPKGGKPIELISTNKPTSQISNPWGGKASRAVDGNTDTNYGHGSCTHTHWHSGAWWKVDLGASYHINHVVVWNREDCCAWRLNNFEVLAGDHTCGITSTAGHPGSSYIVQCNNQPADTVTVRLTGANYLTLCEVQVYGFLASDVKNMTQCETDKDCSCRDLAFSKLQKENPKLARLPGHCPGQDNVQTSLFKSACHNSATENCTNMADLMSLMQISSAGTGTALLRRTKSDDLLDLMAYVAHSQVKTQNGWACG